MLSFAGRAKQIHEIELIVKQGFTNLTNALCITGEPGIGKASLAYRLYQDPSLSRYFDNSYAMSAYMMPWESLVPRIARMFLTELPLRTNIQELEERLLNHIKEGKFFLILDNIDNASQAIVDFIKRWSEAERSFLIVTMRSFPTSVSPPSNCRIYELQGISEKEDWLIDHLLGEQMVARIDQQNLRQELKILKGNPQKLLYLRWRAPETRDDILSCIQDLSEGATQIDAIESVLRQIRLPLEHFLALGRVRVPEINEDLLAFLWDRLERGGTALFAQTLQQLLNAKALERTGHGHLRVNAHVHAQLQQALERILGPEQRSNIEYYIGAYFRNRFSSLKNTNGKFSIHDLDNYVYHTVMSGSVASAHAYIFDTDHLESAHRQGLSLELEPILHYLDQGLNDKLVYQQPPDKMKTVMDKEKGRLAVMASQVKLELGRVCKDLSRHNESLDYLNEATLLLDSPMTAAVRDVAFHRLCADVKHNRGIAYSQVGRTLECIEAYLDSIKYATDHQFFGPSDALSVGYLAYELKFHDIEQAHRIGLTAVELASKLHDRRVQAKNLCSLGQIRTFMGKVEQSKEDFNKAERLCRKKPVDKRELGRILVNSAVAYISSGEWDEAESQLNEMITFMGESGDRRRMSIADAYRGIIWYRQDKKSEGQRLVLNALHQHKEIAALREMIYEALTWAWMEFDINMPEELATVLQNRNLPMEVYDTLKDILEQKSNVFVNFWKSYYLPTLLTSDVKRID